MGLLNSMFGRKSAKTVRYEIKPAGTVVDADGWLYREYTDPSDSPFTIRIEQSRPGNWKRIVEWCRVAGINVPERGGEVLRFYTGSYRWLELEREPDNQYDANAIRVIGTSRDPHGVIQRIHIGYVPRDIAQNLAEADVSQLWVAIRFITFPNPDHGPQFAIRFDIFKHC